MTTVTEHFLKVVTASELNRLARPENAEARARFQVTRQDVLDELHDRALIAYHVSSQGLDDLVVALGHAVTGRLAGFTGVKLIRALGVIADQADDVDWTTDLAEAGLTRQGVLDSLRELATRWAHPR